MTDKKIIFYESEEAASLKTVTGWVSSDGRFFGDDERIARWNGCTHKTCACGRPMTKHWIICDECRAAKDLEKFLAMPERVAGAGLVYSNASDTYFNDIDDAIDHAADEGISLHEMQLIICEPVRMKQIDEDYWADDLAEDFTINDSDPVIAEKLDELNELIESRKPVLSWFPGKYRVSLADYSQEEAVG